MYRKTLMLSFGLMLLLPAAAMATDDVPNPNTTLALPTDQIWTLAVGALVPLVTYGLNYVGPWLSEAIKAIILVVVSAIAGGITQAIVAGDVGFNATTLQFVLTAVIAALSAHRLLWRPSTISTKLGGGRNRNRDVVASTSDHRSEAGEFSDLPNPMKQNHVK
jgi:peptidoglycan/LPS O-acetylase OafA/YrhL